MADSVTSVLKGVAAKKGLQFSSRFLGNAATALGWAFGGYSAYKTFATYSKNDPYNEQIQPFEAELEKWRGAMWPLLAAPYTAEKVQEAKSYVQETSDFFGIADFAAKKDLILERLDVLEGIIDAEGEDAPGCDQVVQNMMEIEMCYADRAEELFRDRNKRFLKYAGLSGAAIFLGTLGGKMVK